MEKHLELLSLGLIIVATDQAVLMLVDYGYQNKDYNYIIYIIYILDFAHEHVVTLKKKTKRYVVIYIYKRIKRLSGCPKP